MGKLAEWRSSQGAGLGFSALFHSYLCRSETLCNLRSCFTTASRAALFAGVLNPSQQHQTPVIQWRALLFPNGKHFFFFFKWRTFLFSDANTVVSNGKHYFFFQWRTLGFFSMENVAFFSMENTVSNGKQ